MRIVTGVLAGLLWCAMSLVVLSCTQAADIRQIRIGLVDTLGRGLPAEVRDAVMLPFKSLMETQVGLRGELAPDGGNAFHLARRLRQGEVDLGVFHGHEFAWVRAADNQIEAVAVCVSGTVDSTVHLVVAKSSRFRSVADLKGRNATLARLTKGHCRLFFERRCVTEGLTPSRFYRQIRMPFDVPDALDEVYNGHAACTVVDSASLAAYQKTRPSRAAKLQTLLQSEPFPPGTIAAYRGRFSAEELKRIRDGLVATSESSRGRVILAALRLTGFETPPADLDARLETIARHYPPPK